MLEIKITVSDAGAINVSGPLENKVQMLGLLEIAKSVVLAYQPKQVIAAPGAALHALPKIPS